MWRVVESKGVLWVCAFIVAAAHAAVLFGWAPSPAVHSLRMDGESPGVEVELAASSEQESEEIDIVTDEPTTPEQVEQPIPEPTPPALDPPAEPYPLEEEPQVSSEAQVPKPAEPAPVPPRPAPTPSMPKQNKSVAAPSAKARASLQATGSAMSGLIDARSSQAAFAKRPSLIYPAESRQAREEGTVVIRITVDSRGRPTHVVVIKGSGFPRLDRAAVEGAWRCRIRNAKAGAILDVPLRFNLDE